MIKVLSVDDHPLLREGIAALVNAECDMKLVAEATIATPGLGVPAPLRGPCRIGVGCRVVWERCPGRSCGS
jgi:hypothetical protein